MSMVRIVVCSVVTLAFAWPMCARDTCVATSLKDDYKRASIVMLGEAVSRARFKVLETWKGAASGEIVFDASQFQFDYPPGTVVLVFAYRGDSAVPYLHDCSHTDPVGPGTFVEREIRTIRARYRWWNSPISSFGWRRRAQAP